MSNIETKTDVILIGAGIMSATLGTLLKELAPDWNIKVFEQLDKAGEESSNEWNNAGTGHAALCELNYTSENADGTVNIAKAINVNEQFQVSKQFWAYLVNKNLISNPENFIMPLPHMSMVQGEENVQFLKRRYEAMKQSPLFQDMEFSENPEEAMRRQRDHYLPRGISDLGNMQQCMKYADLLIKEKGFSEEDADRRAAATFEFKQQLQERGQLEGVYNQKKRDKYVNILVKKDVEDGAEEASARRRYLNAFRAVQEFNEANI